MSNRLATVLAVCAGACAKDLSNGAGPSGRCTQPLDSYCFDCPTFDAARDVALTHGEAPPGWGDAHYGGDVFVWQCEEQTNIIRVQFAGSLASRDEYYDRETGLLIGVGVWSDAPLNCGDIWELYGETVECKNACLSDYSCLPEDDPHCVDFVADADAC